MGSDTVADDCFADSGSNEPASIVSRVGQVLRPCKFYNFHCGEYLERCILEYAPSSKSGSMVNIWKDELWKTHSLVDGKDSLQCG